MSRYSTILTEMGQMKTIRLSTDDTLKLYRANTKRFLFAWVASGLCVSLWSMFAVTALISTFRQTATVPIGLLAIQCMPFAMSFALLLHIWNKTRNTYLIISVQGIEYHAGWQHIVSTWDNVQGIQTRIMPYLILHRSVIPEWLLLFARDQYAGRRIPLWPFNYSPQSELARDIRAFAPHIFTGNASQKS